MKHIAIVMTVFNRRAQTIQCLENIKAQTIHNNGNYKVDIFLTNDGCTDGTPEVVRDQFPYVNIIEGDGNLFWNRGMYAAWQEAAKGNYDYYLWLNDDTYLRRNSIERLVSCSEDKQDETVIIGSCCSSSNEEEITYGGHTQNGKLIKDVSSEKECVVFHGNIVLIPRFIFEQIGFNDRRYRHAMGDFDYSLMVHKKGLKAYVAKGVFGVCDLHTSKPKWCDSNVRLTERWKAFHKPGGNGSNPFEFFYYKKKNYGLIPACITFISNYIHVLFPRLWEK